MLRMCIKTHLSISRLTQDACAAHESCFHIPVPLRFEDICYVCCFLMLRATSAQVNEPNYFSASPLLVSAQKGHVETTLLLLRNYANVNQPTENGITPLYAAANRWLFL
jgi:hypothetical protein